MLTAKPAGLLFDSTLCIGCGACSSACKARNHLPKTAQDPTKDTLSDQTFSVLESRNGAYVRRMCMHCQDPTCASVCPVAALVKTPQGPVVYRPERCIGCRYCMQACPFKIPKYEWGKVNPTVKKCDLCADRLNAGFPTACAEACPTGATRFGDRESLLALARERINANPQRYINQIYGAQEVGGTSVLILSKVPLEALGYPENLSTDPLPMLTWEVLKRIPNFAALGGVLLGGIWWISNRRTEVSQAEGRSNAQKEDKQ